MLSSATDAGQIPSQHIIVRAQLGVHPKKAGATFGDLRKLDYFAAPPATSPKPICLGALVLAVGTLAGLGS